MNLKAVRVAAPDPETRRLKLADAAVGKSQQRQKRIVYRTARHECLPHRETFRHASIQIQRRIEQMREQIVSDAGSRLRGIHLPRAVARPIRPPLLAVRRVVMEDRPETSGAD